MALALSLWSFPMFSSSRVPIVNFSAAFISLAALTVTGTSATAQTYDWSGFSVYAGIGAGRLDADVTVHDETRYHPKYLSCDPIEKKPKGFDYDGKFCHSYTKYRLPHGIAKNAFDADSNSNFNFLGTAGVAADFEFSPGFVIGAFADADLSNASVDFFGTSKSPLMSKRKRIKKGPMGSTTIAGELEQDWSFSLGGRLGMLTPNRQGMIYVLAAYTQVHMDSSTATIQNSLHIPYVGVGHAPPISVSMPTTFDGLTLGVGGELKLSNNWSLKAEGRYTNLNSKTVGYSGGGYSKTALGVYKKGYYKCSKKKNDCQKNLHMHSRSKGTIDVDPDIYSARVVLSYRFN